uniref:Core Histone H2A/H2B/H3 domain-containing protein n=1 Tax=Fagus sylvatica TaxID=28930 RepID=A0A2N9EFZ2_FAGSY
MDLNQPMDFTVSSSPSPSPQVHSFMPMPSFMLSQPQYHQTSGKMVSADTPIVFSKACELFILELTLRSWLQAEECRRRTLQRCDIARAVRLDDLLDFLIDVVPLDHDHYYKEEGAGKKSEQNESRPADQILHLPMMMNARELAMTNPELSGSYMIAQSMPSAEQEYDFPSKCNFIMFSTAF